MLDCTAVLIRRRGEVLLPRKKTGEIGKGLNNAPGGKIDAGESPLACAVREVREETGLRVFQDHLMPVATISCFVMSVLHVKVYIYLTGVFTGEPVETREAIPEWFHWTHLPYENMHSGDIHWFAKALGSQKFDANVYYQRPGEGFLSIDFHPSTPFPP